MPRLWIALSCFGAAGVLVILFSPYLAPGRRLFRKKREEREDDQGWD